MLDQLKNAARVGAIIVFCSLAAGMALAHGNPRGNATAAIGKTKVSVDYGRIYLKGRDLMKMIEVGQLWRVGADAPTTITSNAPLIFGGQRVPAGSHILLARYVEPGHWTLVVSSKSAFEYQPAAKLAEIPLDLTSGQPLIDLLTVTLQSRGGQGTIEIAWGAYRLTGSFQPANQHPGAQAGARKPRRFAGASHQERWIDQEIAGCNSALPKFPARLLDRSIIIEVQALC